MRKQLEEGLGPIEFADLRAHLARGAVITVDPTVDLLDVGEAVARDDKTRVTEWIDKGLIGKPDLTTIETWSKREGPAWNALVVQPFVLVQDMPASERPS